MPIALSGAKVAFGQPGQTSQAPPSTPIIRSRSRNHTKSRNPMNEFKYPKTIKVEVTAVHLLLLVISLLIWPVFFVANPDFVPQAWPKLCSVLGLFLNTVGATVATLKPPAYGFFADGGDLQRRCDKLAGKYFTVGMLLVAAGFMVQAAKEVFSP